MSDDSRFDPAAIALLHRVGGENFVGKMTALFAAGAPGRLDAMSAAIDASDHSAGAAAAHSLKSSAGQIGAARLQQLSTHLEDAFLRADLAAARALLAESRLELEAALQWTTQRRDL